MPFLVTVHRHMADTKPDLTIPDLAIPGLIAVELMLGWDYHRKTGEVVQAVDARLPSSAQVRIREEKCERVVFPWQTKETP